jgi:hypothetical protein
MRRIFRLLIMALLGVTLFCAILLLLSPSARLLAPLYLYYDLVGRRIAPPPPEVEQFVLRSGEEYCSAGRDSECGGYRIVGVRSLAFDQVAQPGVTAAWCVDYAVRRRNQGGLTRDWIFWANIPRAMVVTRSNDGQYGSTMTDDCRTVTPE